MEIPVSCNKDCGGGCPLAAVVEDGRIVRITDSKFRGPWMNGCLRGYRAHKLTYHPERLKQPLIKNRATGSFKKAGWDEALDYTAERLSNIRLKYGPLSIMRLGGSGACRGALHNTSRLTRRFLNLFGGFTETTGSFSSAAVSFATPFVYGTSNAAVDAGSLMRSKFVFLPGANIADLRFGPELMNRLVALRKSGVRIIVADPRKTRTVSRLDAEWIRLRPGTDSALMASVIYELSKNGGIDKEFISKYCTGWEPFRKWLYSEPAKTPEWAAEICGITIGEILDLADCYRRYKPVALIPGLSIQRTLGGEDTARMAMILQSVTGNTGIPGGTSGANIWGPMPGPVCGKISENPGIKAGRIKRYYPVYTWAEQVLKGGQEPPVKALYNCGGNYITQGADTAKCVEAFSAAEFSVTHDFFMTATASCSDVVFPTADFLERNDIVFPEGNFLLYSARAVAPPEGVRTDYEIFSMLSERLGFGNEFTEGRNEQQWLSAFLSASEVDDVDEFLRTGIWFAEKQERTALSDFIEDPVLNPLSTPSGLIEISSETFKTAGGNYFPVYLETGENDRFRLITPHSRSRINSQYANMEKGQKKLQINETDAASLDIADGDEVCIKGGSGSIIIPAYISRDIICGTVCLEAGTWADFDIGGTDRAGSANVVTSDIPTMPSGGSRTHTTYVEIFPVKRRRKHEY